MQVTVRSYLMAGMAAAGITALAVAPLPSLESAAAPDIRMPSVQNTALQDDLVAAFGFTLEQVQILNGGALTSAGFTNSVLPTVATGLVALPVAIAAAPQLTPTILGGSLAGLETLAVGVPSVLSPSVSSNVPGAYIPADLVPNTKTNQAILGAFAKTNILGGTTVALNQVANNLTKAGAPPVLEQSIRSTEKVGVSVIQAQGLVRNATVGAVQGVVTAATSGGNAGGAVQTGANNIGKSVFGDPNGGYVDPVSGKTSATSKTGYVPTVKKLGAIGTVTSTVQAEGQKVAGSLGN